MSDSTEGRMVAVDSETAAIICAFGAVAQAASAPDRASKSLPIAQALLLDLVLSRGFDQMSALAIYARSSHLLEGLECEPTSPLNDSTNSSTTTP